MVKVLELREMIKLVSKSSIQEFNLKNNGVKIMMKKPHHKVSEIPEDLQTAFNEAAATSLEEESQKDTSAKPKVECPSKELSHYQIVSPVIGVFYSSRELGEEPYVKVGDKIIKGQIVSRCIVEALELEQEVLSDIDGEIVQVFVKDGEVVDFGQPLFEVKLG
jgi:acetyl-CoA carboxylase biotin carboxyl carrier protein